MNNSDYDKRPGKFVQGRNCVPPTEPSQHTHIAVIDSSATASCQMCGKQAELRPYGPNGESICFACGMKDEESTKKQFSTLLDANSIVVIK